ncbi:MAG TPA: signal peptide peptidase SppA [Myxococcota bacterium]|nr:signal peptide peptidase SppA [Myxococcota bacterium]
MQGPRSTFGSLWRCLAIAPLSLACVSIELPGGVPQALMETTVEGAGSAKILLLQIDGVLTDEPEASWYGLRRESPVARVREELDRARRDDSIDALLVRIDTPGGTVTASDLLYQEILRFKHERGVPVVAQLMGMATSGGYYVAMSADTVIAHPTTVTGSIGVIFAGVNLSGLMAKYGVADQTLTSGPFKDAGSPLRPMRPDERAQLQSVIDDMYQRFLDVVRRGRPALAPDEVARLADGRIYSAQQALANGLVDRIGDVEDAVELARTRAGVEEARVVTYHRPREYRKNLYTAEADESAPRVEWPMRRLQLPQPAFLYLWAPSGLLD